MALVDADDDSLHRWVVWHFRFDPDRGERRNVTVAAYDNQQEMIDRFDAEHAALNCRKREGAAEEQERIGGGYKSPGHRDLMAAQRTRPRPRGARIRRSQS